MIRKVNVQSKYGITISKNPLNRCEIKSSKSEYNTISYLSNFTNIKIIENEIVPHIKNALNNLNESHEESQKEWIEPVGGFIRISSEFTRFGQYVDENLGALKQFELYVDEGEKIYGTISTAEFYEIIEIWLLELKTL